MTAVQNDATRGGHVSSDRGRTDSQGDLLGHVSRRRQRSKSRDPRPRRDRHHGGPAVRQSSPSRSERAQPGRLETGSVVRAALDQGPLGHTLLLHGRHGGTRPGLKEASPIATGQCLGRVGHAGNAQAVRAHLHIEESACPMRHWRVPRPTRRSDGIVRQPVPVVCLLRWRPLPIDPAVGDHHHDDHHDYDHDDEPADKAADHAAPLSAGRGAELHSVPRARNPPRFPSAGWDPPEYRVDEHGKVVGARDPVTRNNWGRFGELDQIGTANHLTDRARRRPRPRS